MEIILLEKVSKLGSIGEVLTVKNGYARNFLIPTGKAVRATEANKQSFEARKQEIAKENLARKAEAEKIAAQLPKHVVVIRQAGDDGKLFGSVAARDVSNAINEATNLDIQRTQVELKSVVKFIGSHEAHVILHPEVVCSINVVVSRTEEEAKSFIGSDQE